MATWTRTVWRFSADFSPPIRKVLFREKKLFKKSQNIYIYNISLNWFFHYLCHGSWIRLAFFFKIIHYVFFLCLWVFLWLNVIYINMNGSYPFMSIECYAYFHLVKHYSVQMSFGSFYIRFPNPVDTIECRICLTLIHFKRQLWIRHVPLDYTQLISYKLQLLSMVLKHTSCSGWWYFFEFHAYNLYFPLMREPENHLKFLMVRLFCVFIRQHICNFNLDNCFPVILGSFLREYSWVHRLNATVF